MIKQIAISIIASLFLLFAGLQYNDPDAWLWIPIYLAPAILFVLLLLGRRFTRMAKLLAIIFSFSLLLYIPDFLFWADHGFPSLVEEMKTTKYYIEFIREFFGLALIAISLWTYPFFCRGVSD